MSRKKQHCEREFRNAVFQILRDKINESVEKTVG